MALSSYRLCAVQPPTRARDAPAIKDSRRDMNKDMPQSPGNGGGGRRGHSHPPLDDRVGWEDGYLFHSVIPAQAGIHLTSFGPDARSGDGFPPARE